MVILALTINFCTVLQIPLNHHCCSCIHYRLFLFHGRAISTMLFELLLTCATLASAAPSSLQARQGPTFSASFTECVFPNRRAHVKFTDDCHRYSGCNQPSVACGLNGGQYHAAVSQNFFGVGPGAGAGPGCGICFSLTSSVPGTAPITVKIDDLCPVEGNPLCAQDGLQGTNSMGMSSSYTTCSKGCDELTIQKVRT